MTPRETQVCTLLTASCTTHITDWIHGELWICSDGLLRRALGLRTTIMHGGLATVHEADRPTRQFSQDELDRVTRERKRNHWIPWNAIARAKLGRGLMTDALIVTLHTGTQLKFTWLSMDGAHDALRSALTVILGDRLDRS